MSDLKDRRRQLLNLTITEIILMLLFLILLITATLISKNNQLIKESKKFKNLNESDVAQMAAVKEAIKKAIGKGEYAKMTPADITKTVTIGIRDAKKNKGAEQEKLALTDQLKVAEDEVKRLNEKYGVGIPPCWIKDGTIDNKEYLYDAIINDNGIILNNTDSRYSHRINDRKKLPLNNVIEGTVLSIEEFLKQTLAVYELKKDTCRHYISIYDKMLSNNKNHWNKNLDAIEDHFYKYINK